MVAMEGFDHLLHWKLKVGSHAFPDKDGGTCINEAAVVAAGFAYRSICAVEEMPDCFSRPICRLAMHLNDDSTECQRQRLLPYVTRLACADTPEVEKARAAYIRQHAGNYRYFGVSFEKGLEVLDCALTIGRQADPLGPDQVETRMEAALAARGKPRRVQEAASAPNTPFFTRVKDWLMKEVEPAA